MIIFGYILLVGWLLLGLRVWMCFLGVVDWGRGGVVELPFVWKHMLGCVWVGSVLLSVRC